MIQQQTHKQSEAALKLQKLWRSYTNRKIYKYYKDIINFKCKGDPAKLLKGINPSEGYLLETSSNCHVRFKLGGEYFPPVIYYKIFTSSNVIDINAFAPRDYAALPRKGETTKVAYSEYIDHKSEYEKQGWYLRCDNNGWRPISHKMFTKSDYIQNSSSRKVQYYHYNKQKRLDKCSKKARSIRAKWMKQMYEGAKQTKMKQVKEKQQQEEDSQEDNYNPDNQYQDEEMQLYDPTKHKVKIEDAQIIDDEDLEREVKTLLDWSDNLDYLQYAKYWFTLSTSEPSNKLMAAGTNKFKTDTFLTSKQTEY